MVAAVMNKQRLPKSVLLIGGTGLLSSEVRDRAIKEGFTVYILNRGVKSKSSLPPDVIFLKADVKKKDEVQLVLKEYFFDVVVDFISYQVSDIKNTLTIFKNRCEQFIFISTACVFDRSRSEIVTEGSKIGSKNWIYAKNKAACEQYLVEYCKAEDVSLYYTIVRPYITYGHTRIPYGIMPDYGLHWSLIARIVKKKPIFVWDGGNAVTTLTHISDFSRGLVGLFLNKRAKNDDFNIVSDERITWKNFLHTLDSIICATSIIIDLPTNFICDRLPEYNGMLTDDRALNAIFDNSKLKHALPGFKFKVKLDEGLRQAIESYKNNSFFSGIDYSWDAKIDDLISSYLKHCNSSKFLKLHYVDYLMEKSLSNHFFYCINKYAPVRFSKFVTKLIRYLEMRFKC